MTMTAAANGQAKQELDERLKTVLNAEVPLEIRLALLNEWIYDDSPAGRKALAQMLNRAAAAHGDELAEAKRAEYEQLIDQLKAGPLRPATYIGPFDTAARQPTRIRIRTPSGEEMSTPAPDDALRASLKCGDLVWLDAQGRAALFKQENMLEAGEVVRFERRCDDRRIIVSVHDQDSQVLVMSAALAEQVKQGRVAPGAKLLACLKRQMAFEVLDEEGPGHFRYLSRDPLPDVRLDREIGSPPKYVGDVLAHIRREVIEPGYGRRYRIRRAQTKLLAGVSGSGKTLSIEATIRAAYEMLAEHFGVPVESLPPRVMRLRMAEVGSMWFSQTDKNIDRYFDEVLALSEQKFTAPDGSEHELPVFSIIEEADSLGMSRGGEETYSRIQGTLLQRLDANARRFGERFIIVLATTNVPHLLDSAFLRRVGGTIERFGRLTRGGCLAVLQKHLAGLPITPIYGDDPQVRERRLIRDVAAWLFGETGDDPEQVEVTYVGSANPAGFRRRAFLTGGLIDRAVQQAAHAACRLEADGADEPGLTAELLIEAFDAQIRSIVEQLFEHNVGHHLTLPHGVRVAQVRRLDPPPLTRRDLLRV